MQYIRAISFLCGSIPFLLVHLYAMEHFLYFHFWWIDVVMHTWGGVLITLGVWVLADLPSLPIGKSWSWVLSFICITTISWEVFEFSFGLISLEAYIVDTIQDIVVAFVGGSVMQLVLMRYS